MDNSKESIVRLVWEPPYSKPLNVLTRLDIAHAVRGEDLVILLKDGAEVPVRPGEVVEFVL